MRPVADLDPSSAATFMHSSTGILRTRHGRGAIGRPPCIIATSATVGVDGPSALRVERLSGVTDKDVPSSGSELSV